MNRFVFTIIILFCLSPAICPAQTKSSATKTNIEQQIGEAVRNLSDGDVPKAKIIVERLLQSSRQMVSVQTLAGIIAERENDLAAAEKHFALSAKLDPKSAASRNNYGAILTRLNRKKEAADEFTASLAINPKQPSALINLAQIRFEENDLNASRSLFEKASLITDDLEVWHSLLLISLKSKDTAKTGADFEKYFEKLKTVAADPNALDAQIALGKTLLINDFLDESKAVFEFISAKEPNNIEALVRLSQILLRQNKLAEAGRLLESAVARGLTDGKIYAALAEVYKSGGYYENAVPAMLLAIEKEPANSLYYALYGLLLIDAKAPAAAIIRLNESSVKFPESAKILLALGMAQIYDGKPIDAKNSLEKALKLEPNSIAILGYLADVYVNQARYAEALNFYARALKIEENSVLHYLVADTMLKIPTSDALEIQNHLLQAIALDEKLAPAHFALGKVYARDNKWELANAEFEKATGYAPESSEAFYQLGRSLARLKRMEESAIAFDKYKSLNEKLSVKGETDRQELVRRLANVRF